MPFMLAGEEAKSIMVPVSIHEVLKVECVTLGVKKYELIAFLVLKLAEEIGLPSSKESQAFVRQTSDELRDLLDNGKIDDRVGEAMLMGVEPEKLFAISFLKGH